MAGARPPLMLGSITVVFVFYVLTDFLGLCDFVPARLRSPIGIRSRDNADRPRAVRKHLGFFSIVCSNAFAPPPSLPKIRVMVCTVVEFTCTVSFSISWYASKCPSEPGRWSDCLSRVRLSFRTCVSTVQLGSSFSMCDSRVTVQD